MNLARALAVTAALAMGCGRSGPSGNTGRTDGGGSAPMPDLGGFDANRAEGSVFETNRAPPQGNSRLCWARQRLRRGRRPSLLLGHPRLSAGRRHPEQLRSRPDRGSSLGYQDRRPRCWTRLRAGYRDGAPYGPVPLRRLVDGCVEAPFAAAAGINCRRTHHLWHDCPLRFVGAPRRSRRRAQNPIAPNTSSNSFHGRGLPPKKQPQPLALAPDAEVPPDPPAVWLVSPPDEDFPPELGAPPEPAAEIVPPVAGVPPVCAEAPP
jgi:hypothetical protein